MDSSAEVKVLEEKSSPSMEEQAQAQAQAQQGRGEGIELVESSPSQAKPIFIPRKRESSAVGLWFYQLATMLRTDAILTFLRGWKATLLTIFAPIVFLLLLFIIQEVAKSLGVKENLEPRTYELPEIPPCTVGAYPVCLTIVFSPDTPETRTIVENLERGRLSRLGLEYTAPEISVLTSAEELPETSAYYAAAPSEEFIYDMALNFPNLTQYAITFDRSGNDFRYLVWFNHSLSFNETQGVEEIYSLSLTSLLRGVDEAILQVATDEVNIQPIRLNAKAKDWPTRAAVGLSDSIIRQGGPMFFFCSAMINFLLILNTIVSEKEHRLRHGMQMMGLQPSVYWTSWLLINTVIVILSSLVTCLFGMAFGFKVFTNSDFSVVFILFFVFSEAMIFFAFFVTTLVRRVRAATLVGIFILIIGLVFMLAVFSSNFTGYIWWEQGTGRAGWIILLFFPPFNFGKIYLDVSALSVGYYDIANDKTIEGPGFNWGDLYDVIPKRLQPPFGTYDIPPPVQSLYFLMLDIVIYGVLTWYLDNVIPDEFGNSRPLYFFLMPSYWGIRLGKKKRKVLNFEEMLARAAKEQEDEDVHAERLKALSDEQSGDAAVRLLYLRKVYTGGLFKRGPSKVAVDGSCWTLNQGSLLALLGQNGAGKSTTINMLCGFSKCTSGDAFIFDHSVRTEMPEIRSFMGVCPQHDILFSNLTAKEHIELFAGIKNIPRSELTQLIQERLQAVRLFKVKDRRAGTYSGGMKRRLSVAISTIGDPKIIFMDEPTTGMDPVNRRHVWSFIENFKQGRAIILTTHSMEEADILGDSIAIMALGSLRAFGTSTSLKGKFGAGYRVSLVTEKGTSEAVRAELQSRIKGAQLEDDSAGALIFRIPIDSIEALPTLVEDLESKKIEGVREWGISQSTLEEVFLKIIREVNPTHSNKPQ